MNKWRGREKNSEINKKTKVGWRKHKNVDGLLEKDKLTNIKTWSLKDLPKCIYAKIQIHFYMNIVS